MDGAGWRVQQRSRGGLRDGSAHAPGSFGQGLGSGRWSLGSGASQVRDDDDPVSTLSLRLQNSLEGPASCLGPARILGMDKPLPSPGGRAPGRGPLHSHPGVPGPAPTAPSAQIPLTAQVVGRGLLRPHAGRSGDGVTAVMSAIVPQGPRRDLQSVTAGGREAEGRQMCWAVNSLISRCKPDSGPGLQVRVRGGARPPGARLCSPTLGRVRVTAETVRN